MSIKYSIYYSTLSVTQQIYIQLYASYYIIAVLKRKCHAVYITLCTLLTVKKVFMTRMSNAGSQNIHFTRIYFIS